MEPKGRVPRTAKLLVGSERAPVDCQVINLSAVGAWLQLHTMLQLPKRFEFLHGTTHNVSQLVWRAATSSAFATRRPPTSRCAAIDRAERLRSKARCRVAGFGITTPERFAIRRSSAKLGFSLRFIDLVSRPIVRARYKTCIDNREG
jgi:hypothetical protein